MSESKALMVAAEAIDGLRDMLKEVQAKAQHEIEQLNEALANRSENDKEQFKIYNTEIKSLKAENEKMKYEWNKDVRILKLARNQLKGSITEIKSLTDDKAELVKGIELALKIKVSSDIDRKQADIIFALQDIGKKFITSHK